MSNPVTSWILSHMESPKTADAKMVDRIAEDSINAQKMVDETHGNHRPYQFWKRERRSREFDHYMVAHSTLKTSEGGYRSSQKSMKYYQDKTAKRRDELLAMLADNEQNKQESA